MEGRVIQNLLKISIRIENFKSFDFQNNSDIERKMILLKKGGGVTKLKIQEILKYDAWNINFKGFNFHYWILTFKTQNELQNKGGIRLEILEFSKCIWKYSILRTSNDVNNQNMYLYSYLPVVKCLWHTQPTIFPFFFTPFEGEMQLRRNPLGHCRLHTR